MNQLAIQPESIITSPSSPGQLAIECWFDDSCVLDMDYFVRTLCGIKAKGVRPDLIGSIITNYASKWLPDLSDNDPKKQCSTSFKESPESVTALWMKKRFFVETLVGILPPEKDCVPCNFLLRLLRTAIMVGVENGYRLELEKRVSWQLDQASLKELMIPSFSHTCGTLLDFELILRLVKRFLNLDEAVKSGVALVKVAKLVDCYLAEAAIDANLGLKEFIALAGTLPSHARATDDGLYQAIDTYLKYHTFNLCCHLPKLLQKNVNDIYSYYLESMVIKISLEISVNTYISPKTGAFRCIEVRKKSLCRLIDSRKLSSEASVHATQNERLPIRAIIQVLFSEYTKLNRPSDLASSFSSTRSSKNLLEAPERCLSKRDVKAQQSETRKLREEVVRLQCQCNSMQAQIDRLMEKKKSLFRWPKLGVSVLRPFSMIDTIEAGVEGGGVGEVGYGRRTPKDIKGKMVQGRMTPKWRKSVS
ncbi:hypothetical protein GIB67_043284 [Kingdonia uniflora]|uniref:NPH3 domain-containing protein n=1 Tax=Kingdonia uniflora TaxID=39325 RepID=A0A7J7M284_9MAGN|nr:hypothetical protein GIB67_043284 [Kingdonia uniflora]